MIRVEKEKKKSFGGRGEKRAKGGSKRERRDVKEEREREEGEFVPFGPGFDVG